MSTSIPTPPPPFSRVLVANRGEIAIRVMRTLRELGCTSIAIYSDADRDALHVAYADEAWSIGGNLPAESYLVQERVLDIAAQAGADAIHPGYGFLAENANFARACADAGIVFIGPSADAIDQMGSKTRSRAIMEAAGVPIVPGSTEPVESLDDARTSAAAMGYPVAVKARSGGGGKGFRVALTADDLDAAFAGASGEGQRYFSDPAVYLERYLPDPRHVEVQILADHHGNVVHLGERDCTVQRRHQKLIEESPCPVADDTLREQLAAIAIGAARAVGYTNAGTIECLLDANGNAYFLEMNTRVQVEHTVTEMVTGIDIVAEQVWIASGRPLSIRQEDVELRGHAIEVRINAEDPRADFRPASGTITRWIEPGGIGVRVDSGVTAGSVVSPFYDTMLAKLIVHARTREEACRRLVRALDEFQVDGIETLIDFHKVAIASDDFAAMSSCRDLVADPASALPERAPASSTVHVGTSVDVTTGLPLVGHDRIGELHGKRVHVTVFDRELGPPLPPPIRDRHTAGGASDGSVTAPIPGNILHIHVASGERVSAGQVVCVLEAMKMENEIAAPTDGTVTVIPVSSGDAVAAGALLMQIDAE